MKRIHNRDDIVQAGLEIILSRGFNATGVEAIPADLDVEMLAENLIASFQGALLRAKVKKSSDPLKNFIHLYFDNFLYQRKEVN